MKSFLKSLQEGDIATVTQLIDDGIDINQLCSNGKLPLAIVVHAITNTDSWQAKFNPNHLAILKKLIAAGAKVDISNDKQQTLLHQLCTIHPNYFLRRSDGNFPSQQAVATEAVQTLIQANADVNACDAEGSTPLLLAAAHGNKDMVNALLQAKAKITLQPTAYGATLLHFACQLGMLNFIKKITTDNINFDINAKDNNQQTVLDYDRKNLDCVLWLLQ